MFPSVTTPVALAPTAPPAAEPNPVNKTANVEELTDDPDFIGPDVD